MTCRFQDFVATLDDSTKEYFQNTLNSWSEQTLAKANELASKLDSAGCVEPESYVFSEINENFAQSARFAFIKHLWDEIINPASTNGLRNLELEDERCSESLKKIDQVLAPEEKRYLFRKFAIQLGWDFSHMIDEGCSERNEHLPSWALMEVDSETDEFTGRDIGGLHESFMDVEFSGESN